MTLKVIKESSLGWSARIATRIDKFAPNGKAISDKQIANIKEMGLSVDGITETETLSCALSVGSGYVLKNLSIIGVKNIKSVLEKFYNNTAIVEEDIVDLHDQVHIVKSVTCKPIKVTLPNGDVIDLSKNEVYYFQDKLPNIYKDVIYQLSSICGYNVTKYGANDIKVGCHYHNYKRVIAFLDEIILTMEDPTDAQASS